MNLKKIEISVSYEVEQRVSPFPGKGAASEASGDRRILGPNREDGKMAPHDEAFSLKDVPPSEQAIRDFYADPSWRFSRIRYDTIKRAGGVCQLCGARATKHNRIVVDHIVPIRSAWSRRYDPTNLQCLCDCCNKGKGSRDATDWRQPRNPVATERHNWRDVPEGRSLEALIGVQGCKTSLILSIDELISIACAIWKLPAGLDLQRTYAAAVAVGKNERRRLAATMVAEVWPEPTRLWPAECKARMRALSTLDMPTQFKDLAEEIEAFRTKKGGWKREHLALWGVPCPPPPGWRQWLLKHGAPYRPDSTAV